MILAVTVVGVLALVVGLLAVLMPSASPAAPDAAEAPQRPAPAAPDPGRAADGWDVAGQTGLATRPMPVLPQAAALPHALSPADAAPPIRLPAPTAARDGVVPRGYPSTPEGALAQLVALTAAGLLNADPQAYATVYDAVAAPGSPPASATPLYRDLVTVRARAGLPATGAVAELTVDWTPSSGLIKGTTDRGRYVVACVLGQLDVGAAGRVISSGAGDCQALRYVDGRWWISPGAAAAPAPLAWPGSDEAVQVGYRAVTDAR